jgi:hypothetical protein
VNISKQLHDSGQSIWLDTITRELLTADTSRADPRARWGR